MKTRQIRRKNETDTPPIRRSHTTHNLYPAKICYRYHPRYGVTVELVRYLRHGSTAVAIVKLPEGVQQALPEWMLKPEACEVLRTETKPRIAIRALLDLQELMMIQSPTLGPSNTDCAESGSGGQDAQEGGCSPTTVQASVRRRGALDDAARSGARALSNFVEAAARERSQRGREEDR